MPEFVSSFSGLANDRRLTDAELVRAIRFMIAGEYKATQMMNHKYLIILKKTNIVG